MEDCLRLLANPFIARSIMVPAFSSHTAAPVRRTPSFGASMKGAAVLAVDGQQVRGLVMSPHAELGLFLFVPDEPDQIEVEVEEGAEVRIRWRESDSFDAVAEIIEFDGRERWILSVPVQLGAGRQRQSPRMLADGAWSLMSAGGDLLDVYDLSEQGIGIEFPSGEGPAGVGEHIVGMLRADSMGFFEVRVECTNVRPHPDDDRLWIVGGRLEIVDPAAQRQFAAALAMMGG